MEFHHLQGYGGKKLDLGFEAGLHRVVWILSMIIDEIVTTKIVLIGYYFWSWWVRSDCTFYEECISLGILLLWLQSSSTIVMEWWWSSESSSAMERVWRECKWHWSNDDNGVQTLLVMHNPKLDSHPPLQYPSFFLRTRCQPRIFGTLLTFLGFSIYIFFSHSSLA